MCPRPLIVCVCTGNTCRSPMAAALMKRRMEREGIPGKAESAGLAASCEPASQLAVTVMREWDIDLRGHHSRPVTAMLCEAADLVADSAVLISVTFLEICLEAAEDAVPTTDR